MTDFAHKVAAMGSTNPRQPSEQELKFMSMTPEQREEAVRRMNYEAVMADRAQNQKEMQDRIDASVAVSLANNQQLKSGSGYVRSTVSNGQTEIKREGIYRSGASDPNTMNVVISGVTFSGAEARHMADSGMISRDQYDKAVAEADAKYGNPPSFK